MAIVSVFAGHSKFVQNQIVPATVAAVSHLYANRNTQLNENCFLDSVRVGAGLFGSFLFAVTLFPENFQPIIIIHMCHATIGINVDESRLLRLES